MSDLLRRVLTALVLIPLAVGAVILGGVPFATVVIVASCLAQWELYRMAEAGGYRPLKVAGLGCGALIILIPVWPPAVPLATLALLALLAAEVFRGREAPLASVAVAVLGVFYPAALVAWYVHLRLAAAGAAAVGDAGAAWLVVTIFVAVWAADTCAYFTGRGIGRRPLAPRISPKKTIEGSIGGVVGGVAVVILLQITIVPFLTLLDAVVIGLIASVIGPIGDLTESLFKRAVDVKDSGALLPGHGGMLDRIDAMVFVGAPSAIYLEYVARLF